MKVRVQVLKDCKARFKRRATAVPNSIDRIKFDFRTAIAQRLKPSRATALQHGKPCRPGLPCYISWEYISAETVCKFLLSVLATTRALSSYKGTRQKEEKIIRKKCKRLKFRLKIRENCSISRKTVIAKSKFEEVHLAQSLCKSHSCD